MRHVGVVLTLAIFGVVTAGIESVQADSPASTGLPALTSLDSRPLAPAAYPVSGAPVVHRTSRETPLTPVRLPPSDGGQAGCDETGATAGCDVTSQCAVAEPCLWFASVSGLVLTRDKPNRIWTTYETNNNPNQLMTPPNVDWNGGGEVRFGRWFCCGQWGIDVRYWTIDPLSASSSMTNANSVSTPLIFTDLEFAGDLVENIYDGAAEHRLWRTDEMHNVEINLLSGTMYLGSECWSIGGSVGVRYFRFAENLVFGSLDLGGTWGANGGIDEAYLNERIKNDLVGVQIGCLVARRCWQNWRLFVAPQFGIYNNHIQHRMELYRGDGVTATPTVASGVNGQFPVSSSTNVVSFLTQIDLGMDWQISPRWSAMLGYRVMAITGVGLADTQIPTYVIDLPEIANIDHNDDLILHGAFAGLTFNF